MSGVKALRRIQLAPEVTAGTQILATSIWRGLGTLEDQRETVFPNEDIGYIAGVDRAYCPKQAALLALEAVPATFEQLPYIFEMGIKGVTTGVADSGAGATGKIYAYPMHYADTLNTLKTFCAETGDDTRMEKVSYLHCPSFTLTGKPGEAWTIEGDLAGRAVTITKITAATIAFVSATKKITDSGNALAVFTTGMRIKVSGSTSNDGIYTVATGGVAGEIVTTEALVNEDAEDTVTIEQYFTPSLSLVNVEEMLFGNSKLYIDAVNGSLGGSLVSNTLLGASIKVNTGQQAQFTGDRVDFSYVAARQPEVLLDITFAHNSNAVSEIENWRNKTSRKIRISCLGSALGTAGGVYTYKTLFADMAGKWEKFTKLDEQDGLDIVGGTFRARYNSTATLFCTFTVVNEIASL